MRYLYKIIRAYSISTLLREVSVLIYPKLNLLKQNVEPLMDMLSTFLICLRLDAMVIKVHQKNHGLLSLLLLSNHDKMWSNLMMRRILSK
jgi:hypothetical protein